MKPELIFFNEVVELDFGRFEADNSISIRLQTPDGRPVAKICACLAPEYTPPPDCIVVRNYSENAGMLLWLHSVGIIVDELPVEVIERGFVEFPVCRLSPEVLAAFVIAETGAVPR